MIDPSRPYGETLRLRADALATACVHAGDKADATGALDPAIVMSTAFAFESADHAANAFSGTEEAWIYGRWGNPTTEALELKLAALEGAEAACATSSGMAAIAGTILGTCRAGDHIIAPRSMYAESARLLRERLPKLGITTTFVDGTKDAYAEAVTESTRLLYIETPSNPVLGVVDIQEIAKIARTLPGGPAHVLVDATFGTPFCQTPLALGADLVVHSTTKALSGHGDVIGGAVIGRTALVDVVREAIVKGFGGVLAPLSSWLISRGLRTFAVRQERACATAAELATYLAKHPRVARVYHPSLTTHAGHALACAQMFAFGSVLSFELAGSENGVGRGRSVLESLRLATHAVSLGDVRTLVTHPASTTHSTMPKAVRESANIGDTLLRVSCGLESSGELLADFEQALRIG